MWFFSPPPPNSYKKYLNYLNRHRAYIHTQTYEYIVTCLKKTINLIYIAYNTRGLLYFVTSYFTHFAHYYVTHYLKQKQTDIKKK